MTSTQPILEVRNIGHSFDGLHVLRSVDFQVMPGTVVGLIGPNGSGKSTLFNIISGFLRPMAGSVHLEGAPTGRATPEQLSRRGIVRTFQTPQVFQDLTVMENVMVGSVVASYWRDLLGLPSSHRQLAQVREQAFAICQRFRLLPLVDALAGGLSVGQRRNLELARAVAARPRLLMLDEPSSGLNTNEIEVLKEWITTLSAEGLSVLLVSHDMGLMEVAARVQVLYYGEIISSGSMREIQNDARVQQVYLGDTAPDASTDRAGET